MIAGGGVAPAVAAALMRARRRIVRHFETAGATAPGRTTTYVPERRVEKRVLRQFVDRGVLVGSPTGAYWLDRDALAAFRRRLRARVFTAAGLALTLVGLALVGLAAALGR